MSELINTRDNRATIRWKLLTGASALALMAYAISPAAALAGDGDSPLLWVEFGGQAEHVEGQGSVFAPSFLAANPTSSVVWKGTSPTQAQKSPFFDFGESGKISFQPEGSDWIFSASALYGHASNSTEIDHQTSGIICEAYQSGAPLNCGDGRRDGLGIDRFSDTKPHYAEHHWIADFQAGKDVGLGMFGHGGSSVLSVGVRFAQFVSHSSVDMRARPDIEFKYPTIFKSAYPSRVLKWPHFNNYHATGSATREFHGIGPSISWNASAALAGNMQDGEIAFDWGVNGALLFGRQKAKTHHHETGNYAGTLFAITGYNYHSLPTTNGGHNTDRAITVPNVGGSVGLSYRYQDAKLSIGYRYDTFLKAMDSGIDTRDTSNLAFNGPYASISIGLGD